MVYACYHTIAKQTITTHTIFVYPSIIAIYNTSIFFSAHFVGVVDDAVGVVGAVCSYIRKQCAWKYCLLMNGGTDETLRTDNSRCSFLYLHVTYFNLGITKDTFKTV